VEESGAESRGSSIVVIYSRTTSNGDAKQAHHLTSPTVGPNSPEERVHENPHTHEQKNKPAQKQAVLPGLNSPNQNPNKKQVRLIRQN
jgi:hypothetical protein